MKRVLFVCAVVGAMMGLAGTAHAGLLSKASAGSEGSSASAVDVGAVQVSSSQTTYDPEGGTSASWSALTVAGTNVIGRDSDGAWTGEAASVGETLEGAQLTDRCADAGVGTACFGVLYNQVDCYDAGPDYSSCSSTGGLLIVGGCNISGACAGAQVAYSDSYYGSNPSCHYTFGQTSLVSVNHNLDAPGASVDPSYADHQEDTGCPGA